ncbi:MAG: FGGY-family carbohydrate kinase, partial [Pseudomonadota bacterium]
GTGAFVMIDTGKRVVAHPRLLSGIIDSAINVCSYALEGTVNGAGSALQWAEQTWGLEISQPPRGQNPPLFINTVGGLGSPWWQAGPPPRLHGSGPQGCRSKPAQCTAAILESIAFLIFANLQQIIRHGFTIRQLSISGGLSRYDMLCQGLADLSALPVIRSRQSEATARGIAWQAGNQAKAFPTASGQRFEPQLNPALKRRYRRFITIIDESCA